MYQITWSLNENNITMSEQDKEYNGDSIKVLKGLDPVRKRPGMYIGDTDDGSGLHHMVFEVVDNAIDEALAGFCKNINVVIHADGSVSVEDDGRGIPVDIHPEEGVSSAEVVMTILHAGGKFDQNSYKVSGGLHGVGVSVVNALSDKLELTIKRQGHVWQQTYVDGGHPTAPLKAIGDTDKTGTKIHFWPSPSIFAITEFDYNKLQTRLRELSFLNSGVRINITDERVENKHDEFHYQGGIQSFIEYLNNGKNKLTEKLFYCTKFDQKEGINVEVAVQYTDAYADNTFCFTNNIPQKDGGTHRDGFRRGLVSAVKEYIKECSFLPKKDKENVDILHSDAVDGITAIVSVKVPDPKFSSQTKDKLVSSEVSSCVSSVVSEKFLEFLNENPTEAKLIVERILSTSEYRKEAKKIRERLNKKDAISYLPGKLVNCSSKKPEECELYIVEGDSAGGSAKQGRKPEYQAILPLRGKILNVEKTRFDKIISSETIGTLITALGCGIRDAYNPDNLRYHNIVIMTDADVDGAHIRILLLTFFYRQMPDLIERGHIYIAQPPLYKYSKSEKNFRYITDEVEKNEYETSLALNEAQLFVNPDAPPIFGEPLENIFLQYVNLFPLYRRIDRRIPEMLTSELVFVDPLTEKDMKDSAKFENWKNSFESRLKQKEVPGLVYTVHTKFREDKQLYYPEVSVLHYGVTKEYDLPYEFFVSQDYGKIAKVSKIINGLLEENAYVRCGAKTKTVTDFGQVHDFLLKEGLSGIKIMRFKGLGEMNPDELFNTTMNPDHRVFLKVTLNDAIEANEAFTKLMGEEVAPRKEFISENAHLAEIDA